MCMLVCMPICHRSCLGVIKKNMMAPMTWSVMVGLGLSRFNMRNEYDSLSLSLSLYLMIPAWKWRHLRRRRWHAGNFQWEVLCKQAAQARTALELQYPGEAWREEGLLNAWCCLLGWRPVCSCVCVCELVASSTMFLCIKCFIPKCFISVGFVNSSMFFLITPSNKVRHD